MFLNARSVANTARKQHGGKRSGAGRKPKEPTVTKRIPISLLDKVNELIKKHKAT